MNDRSSDHQQCWEYLLRNIRLLEDLQAYIPPYCIYSRSNTEECEVVMRASDESSPQVGLEVIIGQIFRRATSDYFSQKNCLLGIKMGRLSKAKTTTGGSK
jgi:hypothetical protein